jgi:pyruvate dehydrogenase E1 component
VLASTLPNIRAYDPAFAYELATIVRDGVRRMYHDGEDTFYYVTLYNENYPQPPKPDRPAIDEGIIRGLYLFAPAPDLERPIGKVRLVGSGSILQQSIAAQAVLAERGIAAEVYSAPSFALLRRDALEVERFNRLHPEAEPRVPYVAQVLGPDGGPIIAATDWIRSVPDMVSRWLPNDYVSLGTDGFGRSDTREALRKFFQIDMWSIAATAVVMLARCGAMSRSDAVKAMHDLGIDPDAPDPLDL